MRITVAFLSAWMVLGGMALAADRSGDAFDLGPWRRLPVQDGGRCKPLDTLAWETLRTLSNRAAIADPETGRKLDPTAFYLALLFDGDDALRAGGPPRTPGGCSYTPQRSQRKPDKWDRAPMLRVDFLALRRALGIADDQKYVSPLELSQAKIQVPDATEPVPFVAFGGKLSMARDRGLTLFETKALELAGKLWSYQQLRAGEGLRVLPVQDSPEQDWMSVAQLMRSDYDDKADPTGALRKAKQALVEARAAYRADSPEAFNRAAADFLAAIDEAGPTMGVYPRRATIDLEVAYNHWAPFRFAWLLMLGALLFMLLGMGTRWKPFYVLSWTGYAAGVAAILAGFGLRIAISGRAPVTNMYESVVYLGLGAALLGAVLGLFCRSRFLVVAAAAVSTVALILADACPAILDASLHPLQPILRDNFWLVTHVMTITLSYAAFALALGVGDIALGYALLRPRNDQALAALGDFAYKTLQVGVLLLAVGTILGAVWADYAWGRFWGWDPKEVWALIALLGYLAVLHARTVGWVGHFGLAALSVVCFSLVMMAWYGVNFVLGAGLHSYGFGGGGQVYVYGAVLAQFLYVGAAAIRHRRRLAAGTGEVRPPAARPYPDPGKRAAA